MEGLISCESTLDRIWKGKQSLEVFTLERHDQGFIGGGIVCAANFKIRYQVDIDLDWRVRRVSIDDISRPWLSLSLNRGTGDLWYNKRGVELVELAGCQEVDISATPFTNTIALKKLETLNEMVFKVIYIRIPDFDISVVEQVYQQLGSGKFKYENRSSQFSAEFCVDQYGLISEYPDLFRAL